jgi:hypothetical protein
MFDKSSTLGLCAVLALVPACNGRLKVANDGHGGTDADGSVTRTIDAGAGGGSNSTTTVDSGGGIGTPAAGGTLGAGGRMANAGTNAGNAGGSRPIGSGGAPGMPPMWKGNPPACPATQPETDATCSSEGADCGYWSSDGNNYTECRCVAESATALGWDCGSGLASTPACPHDAQPANGTPCFGFKGSLCPYPPRMVCACDPNLPNPNWLCLDPNPVLPGPTAMLDGSKPISEISDADRQAFCLWFATGQEGPGFPPPPDMPPAADGTSGNTGCAFSYGAACRAEYPGPLPVNLCKANLALSTCRAPLSDLIDCAVTLFNSCLPSPRGCGPYLSSPGCSGTIIKSLDLDGQGGKPGLPGSGGLGGFDQTPVCAIRVQ